MSFTRKNPLFVGALTLCALLALAAVGVGYERWSTSRALAKKLVAKKLELAAMRDVTPPPTREVARAIEADLARAEQALAAMQTELKGRGPSAERLRTAKVPVARPDAYFDIATFVEKTRELAKKQEVALRPEASRFGFAQYANEGPDAEHIEPVFRQRLMAQYLLEALLESHPNTLLAVKRQAPLTKREREERDAAFAAAAAAVASGAPPEPIPEVTVSVAEGPDFFSIDSRASARVPGFVDTTAFRFEFTGQTAALRTFLNRLASFELPVLVREVEVDAASAEESVAVVAPEEPAAAAENAAAPASIVLSVDPAAKPAVKKPAPRAPAATPIVAKPLSKFTVTVEYVELITPPPPAEPEATTPNS